MTFGTALIVVTCKLFDITVYKIYEHNLLMVKASKVLYSC